jgi:hypothetical protein
MLCSPSFSSSTALRTVGSFEVVAVQDQEESSYVFNEYRGYASNKYPSLHYGDHPHDHRKAVSNTLSHAILSPYSGTMPTFSIPLGQTETTAESHSGYAFNEYLPLDYSSYPGNTLEAICNSSSSAVPSLCDALSMSPMPSDQNETAAVTDSGYVFNKYHSHNSMEATSPYLDLWHVFP